MKQRLYSKAHDLIVELTNHNTIEKDLLEKQQVEKEYRENNKAILALLLQRGVKVENLFATKHQES